MADAAASLAFKKSERLDEREKTSSELAIEAEVSRARQAKHDAFFSIQDRSDDQIRRELKL